MSENARERQRMMEIVREGCDTLGSCQRNVLGGSPSAHRKVPTIPFAKGQRADEFACVVSDKFNAQHGTIYDRVKGPRTNRRAPTGGNPRRVCAALPDGRVIPRSGESGRDDGEMWTANHPLSTRKTRRRGRLTPPWFWHYLGQTRSFLYYKNIIKYSGIKSIDECN